MGILRRSLGGRVAVKVQEQYDERKQEREISGGESGKSPSQSTS